MLRSQNCPQFKCNPCGTIPHDLAKCLKLGSSITPPPCSITQLIWWPKSGRPLTQGSHLVIKDNSRHTKMSRHARQSESGAVGSHHVLENTGPSHHHPRPRFNSWEALWMLSECLNSSWSFTKWVFWLNHWPVGTVPSLVPSPLPRGTGRTNL